MENDVNEIPELVYDVQKSWYLWYDIPDYPWKSFCTYEMND